MVLSLCSLIFKIIKTYDRNYCDFRYSFGNLRILLLNITLQLQRK